MSSIQSNAKNVGLILLAAGASSRLGRPKQLLIYHGQTLLQYSLQTALASRAHPVMVVLGANAGTLHRGIKDGNVQVVVNAHWQEGMATSIGCGIKNITEMAPAIEGIILMTCDQPYVTVTLLDELIAVHRKTGKQIVACGYDNTFGPPVFFHQTLFDELLRLKGDIGARSIIRQHPDRVAIIPFPEGAFDVDTAADYERIKR